MACSTPSTDCATRLAEAKTALHKLNTGASVASVQYEGRRIQYNAVNKADLISYISRLEAECGNSASTSETRRRPFGVVY